MNADKRLGVIDLMRLLSVAVIFLFHSYIHIGCDYWILNPFINIGAIFMTAFFLISGFSLYYVYNETLDVDSTKSILHFYKKRIISIMPMYWFMVLVYPIWDVVVDKNSIVNNILLFPVEILGIQDTFHSLFGYTHNGGTWFVSCILFCYLIFPFVLKIINDISLKYRIINGLASSLVLLYAPFLSEYLKLEGVYSNVFYRLLEFIIGMLLCSIWIECKDTIWYKKITKWYILIITFLFLVVSVSIVAHMGILGGNYMAYSVIVLPCFSFLAFAGAGISTPLINNSKVIKYLVEISYVFFFAQFYTWKITMKLLVTFGNESNLIRILLSFIICIMISIVMHEGIEKPAKKIMTKTINA